MRNEFTNTNCPQCGAPSKAFGRGFWGERRRCTNCKATFQFASDCGRGPDVTADEAFDLLSKQILQEGSH